MNRVPSSHRLMGCTIEELLHWLPAASNGSLFRVNQVSDMTNQWQIDFRYYGTVEDFIIKDYQELK